MPHRQLGDIRGPLDQSFSQTDQEMCEIRPPARAKTCSFAELLNRSWIAGAGILRFTHPARSAWGHRTLEGECSTGFLDFLFDQLEEVVVVLLLFFGLWLGGGFEVLRNRILELALLGG